MGLLKTIKLIRIATTDIALVRNISINCATKIFEQTWRNMTVEDYYNLEAKLKEMTMNPAHLKLTDEVIDAINGELCYTSKLVEAGRADKHDYGVEGQLVTLEVYIRKAQEAWVNNPGPTEALDALRKVAAIACRALIQHGCPQRKGY